MSRESIFFADLVRVFVTYNGFQFGLVTLFLGGNKITVTKTKKSA